MSHGAPPPGAVDAGAVEGDSGSGCDPGLHGTLTNAMIVLRNSAAARGANFVTVLSTTPPSVGNGCRYVVAGLAYRVAPGAPASAPTAAGDTCDPICSPGYRCVAATCEALCNPVCSGDQVCRADRTCGPR